MSRRLGLVGIFRFEFEFLFLCLLDSADNLIGFGPNVNIFEINAFVSTANGIQTIPVALIFIGNCCREILAIEPRLVPERNVFKIISSTNLLISNVTNRISCLFQVKDA